MIYRREHGRRGGCLLAATLTIALAACGDPATTAPTSSTGSTAPGTTASTTTLPPTTTTILPTTTTIAPSTTTTTSPRLDRSDAATLDRMRLDLTALLAGGPRVSGSASEMAAAAYVAAAIEEITGDAAMTAEVPLPTGEVSRNVRAAPLGLEGPVLLLGAHLDTVAGSPGANDNGSGVVILLEVLRRLVDDPPAGIRVVVMVFGAEERIGDHGHHFGSRHAVADLVAGDALPDLMLSVDMVAVGDTLHVVHFDGTGTAFADGVAIAAGDAGLTVDRIGRGEISDHVAFARAGVPAAMLWRSPDPDYHTPRDDDVDDDAVLAALDVVEAVIAHLEPADRHPHGGGEQRT